MVIDAGIMKYFYYTLFGYGAITFSLVGRHNLNKTWESLYQNHEMWCNTIYCLQLQIMTELSSRCLYFLNSLSERSVVVKVGYLTE